MSTEPKGARAAGMTRGARRAVIVLFVLTLLLSGTSMGFTIVYVHQFCGVINAVTATPVQRPADPAAAPAREQQYEWYQRFSALGRSLWC